jgi:hypothetical protein
VSIGFIKKATGRDVPVDDTDNPLPVVGTVTPGPTPASASTATLGGTFKTVAATGTPERLAAATTLCTSVVLQGYKAQGTINTGNVYVGQGSADAAQQILLAAGASLSITAPPGKFIDLNLIYLDVATAADGVGYLYVV